MFHYLLTPQPKLQGVLVLFVYCYKYIASKVMNLKFHVIRSIINMSSLCFLNCGQLLWVGVIKKHEEVWVFHSPLPWSKFTMSNIKNFILMNKNFVKGSKPKFWYWYLFSFHFQAVFYELCQNCKTLKITKPMREMKKKIHSDFCIPILVQDFKLA